MIAEQPAVPDGESDVATVFLGFVLKNGAIRQISVQEPLDWAFAVEDSGRPVILSPGLDSAGKMEPRFTVTFAGNPATGGVDVHSEGVAP